MYVLFYPVAMPLNSSEEPSSSSENMHTILQNCLKNTVGIIYLNVVIAIQVFVIIPLCALVIYIGVRRWLQCSSVKVSHSDHFTYQTVISEFLGLTGLIVSSCGVVTDQNLVTNGGLFIFCSTLFLFMTFDTLTCMERYLAVVYPITYRNLKNVQGVRIRNVAIGCSWLLSVLLAGVLSVGGEKIMAAGLLPITVGSLIIVSFCSLSVLCVLVRPGPGEVGQVKQQVDQPRLRAFYTILIILSVMLLRLGATVLVSVLYSTLQIDDNKKCVLTYPLLWTNLPATFMACVHFLQREKKTCLPFCRNRK